MTDINFFEVKAEVKEELKEKRNYLFGEFLKSINETKRDMFDETEKDVRFVSNMMLGKSIETVLYANEMNKIAHIPKRAHYMFLLSVVPKGRRYAKGNKGDAAMIKKVALVKKYFECNEKRAKENLALLTDAQLKEIKQSMNEGGR